jgi:hypothetical protein
LLKRVGALDMATCPFCQYGVLWIMATIMQGEGSSKRLHYLKCMALVLQVHERLEAQQSLQILPQNEFFFLLGQAL